MEDNYLKLFGNMFYNIKEDQDNKKIIEEASEVLASIIIKYGELINEITARTCRFSNMPISNQSTGAAMAAPFTEWRKQNGYRSRKNTYQ